MSADDHRDIDAKPQRFSVDTARQHAQQAWKKSEFILSRVYGLFRDPAAEWEQIRAEETTVPNILLGYVAPLALIPPVCGIIGALLFEPIRVGPIGPTIISIVVTWVMSVAFVFLLGIVVNTLAETFEADRNELNAQKLAAYSLTPSFLSGVFSLWPPLWWLSLFALAAMVFLMYRGLPIMMRAPIERALGYAASVTIAATVGLLVLLMLASCAIS